MLSAQNFRGVMLDQERRLLSDSTNAVQFLQAGKDGSRQGNLFLSSMPGASSYDGIYNDADAISNLAQTAVWASGPIGAFTVAGP